MIAASCHDVAGGAVGYLLAPDRIPASPGSLSMGLFSRMAGDRGPGIENSMAITRWLWLRFWPCGVINHDMPGRPLRSILFGLARALVLSQPRRRLSDPYRGAPKAEAKLNLASSEIFIADYLLPRNGMLSACYQPLWSALPSVCLASLETAPAGELGPSRGRPHDRVVLPPCRWFSCKISTTTTVPGPQPGCVGLYERLTAIDYVKATLLGAVDKNASRLPSVDPGPAGVQPFSSMGYE